MRKIRVFGLLAAALVLGGIYACDSSNPVAPPGTMLRITANPTLIAINGGSSLITVTGFRPDGNPLNPGTQITFSTSLGVLADTVVEANSAGVATTTLRSSGQIGMATVTAATTAGETMAEIAVTIGDDDTSRPMLTVTVAPGELNINEPAQVIVDVRNADGSPFGSNGQVMLTTSLGCFGSGPPDPCPTETTVTTNAQSRATSEFFSLDEAGTATINAFLGSATAMGMVTIEVQRPQLLMTASPSIVGTESASQIRILARDENGTPLGSMQRIRLVADLGRIVKFNTQVDTDAVETDNSGEAKATYIAGARSGTGMVTATLGTSDPVMVNITIRAAVDEIRLDANPKTIRRVDEGEEINLSAVVLDAQGDTLGGVLVIFTPDFGNFQTGTSGRVVTNAQGRAADVLTVTAEDLQSVTATSFEIKAEATSEGVSREATVTIEILGSS